MEASPSTIRRQWKRICNVAGIEPGPYRRREQLLGALFGFIGILTVSYFSHMFLEGAGAAIVIASAGATAVLVFVVPHGSMSQPWPVIGGHLLSAAIGVTCARYIPSTIFASGAAIGLSIAVMHHFRCLHPPGGATGLTAVIGGEQILAMGYDYLLTPVLINVIAVMLVAFILNLPFSWRRYPAAFAPRPKPTLRPATTIVSREDITYALENYNTPVAVLEDDILEIFRLARNHAEEKSHTTPPQSKNTVRAGQSSSDATAQR